MNNSFDVKKERKRKPQIETDVVPIKHKGVAEIPTNISVRKGKAEREAYHTARVVKTAATTTEANKPGKELGVNVLINNWDKYNPWQTTFKPKLQVQELIFTAEYENEKKQLEDPNKSFFAS